jgi:RNA polymerase sigma-70 factor (ECF subfamily)
VLAATVRVTHDVDAAEEAVQDAYVEAIRSWGRDGVPTRPGAWLTTVARRRALNALRRRAAFDVRQPLLVERTETDPFETGLESVPDDRLRLVFMCCHPALSLEAQVALTLRLVCGSTTAEISYAFLVSQATMAARLTRAKQKIAAASIPFTAPTEDVLAERIDAVLTVIHLLYTTGHTAPSGPTLQRPGLQEQALDLAELVHDLLPSEPEPAGLLALLLVHHARRSTRVDHQGRLIRLEDQDRSRWDTHLLQRADVLIQGALRVGPPRRFILEAAIAAVHALAPSYEHTDWAQLVLLYDHLLTEWPSPVVALNRAVAMSFAQGPAAALREIEAIERDGRLDGYRYLPATKADLLMRLGRRSEATEQYLAALALTENAAERRFLEERTSHAQLTAPTASAIRSGGADRPTGCSEAGPERADQHIADRVSDAHTDRRALRT